ncbi:MAG: class I SAM-dependent methyltransferase [Acidimicrobiales bacterium]
MSGTDADQLPVYDTIGAGYTVVRRPDPRIARRLHSALGGAARVLNVGAGAGSYEPTDRSVVAVEPSITMIKQRPPTAAAAVRAVADNLPFRDATFDGALALLTVHHWPDPIAGLRELRRVTSGPIVVFTFDHDVHARQWLITDYLPAMADLDLRHPPAAEIAAVLGGGTVEVVQVPHDCVDGFCHAWWRRPDSYLDPSVRAGISGIARLPDVVVDRAMARLATDLADGTWRREHHDLVDQEEIDAGYRIVVSTGT